MCRSLHAGAGVSQSGKSSAKLGSAVYTRPGEALLLSVTENRIINVEATLAFASNLAPDNNGYDCPERHIFSQTMGQKALEGLGWGRGDIGSHFNDYPILK